MAKASYYVSEEKKFKLIGWISKITQQRIETEKLGIHWFLEESTKVVGESLPENVIMKYLRMSNLVPVGEIKNGGTPFEQLQQLRDRIARLEHAVFENDAKTN